MFGFDLRKYQVIKMNVSTYEELSSETREAMTFTLLMCLLGWAVVASMGGFYSCFAWDARTRDLEMDLEVEKSRVEVLETSRDLANDRVDELERLNEELRLNITNLLHTLKVLSSSSAFSNMKAD